MRHLARSRLVPALFWLCTACSSFVASGPSNLEMGTVAPLASYLDKGPTKVKVIFVHGVGDHCPGYALGGNYFATQVSPSDQTFWMSDANVHAAGLDGSNSKASAAISIYPDEFLPPDRFNRIPGDKGSYVNLVTRSFTYIRKAGAATTVNVEAIEITWSPLTQWVKNRQLGYDATQPVRKPDDTTLGCLKDPFDPNAASGAPPHRMLANREIKERLFDRALSDAVLYTGDYGNVIRRGVAEALCQAVGGKTADSQMCQWPAASEATQTQYILVTHSLGSRIVYDTLLGLVGNGYAADSLSDMAINARPFVEQILANTSVVYMMANQLPLLGLGNVQVNTDSSSPPKPFRLKTPVSESALAGLNRTELLAAAPDPTAGEMLNAAKVECDNMICAFANESNRAGRREQLDIVAFSDTNDILSWSVPSWYVRDEKIGANDLKLNVTNVFVKNSTHWFGLFEWPLTAHSGYFESPRVIETIMCGSTNGIPNCPS